MKFFSRIYLSLFCLLLLPAPTPACASEIPVFHFSDMKSTKELHENWNNVHFPKIRRHTNYQIIENKNGTHVLQAQSDRSASALIANLNFPTISAPRLQWGWKTHTLIPKSNLTQKSGDDHSLRLYVLFSDNPDIAAKSMRKKASLLMKKSNEDILVLNYIWANKSHVEAMAPSPYTKKFHKIVVRSGVNNLGSWQYEERNIREDFKKAFGKNPAYVIGVMIMTDTDNTDAQATSYYGDISFLSAKKVDKA